MSAQEINFFNYSQLFKKDREAYLGLLTDVMERGAFILQKDLEEFEQNLAKYVGVRYAFGVADCSNALIISLIAAGIRSGDEVIVPSHTFIATAAAIHHVEAIPILADCGVDHLLDPKSVERLITQKTKAILPVHLNGRCCDMDQLCVIAKKNQLTIVEDAAQGLGSKFKNQCAGTFGKAGAYSFYPAKTLGCFGDAGAVVTNDDEIATQIALLRDHGRDSNGEVITWGFNSRLDNIQAAILNFKLRHYEKEICRRREIAEQYIKHLSEVKEIFLPPAPSKATPFFDIFQNFEIEADRRNELKSFLSDKKIQTIIQWGGKPIHWFTRLGFTANLPNTNKIFKRCLLLPMNTFLSNKDVEYICTQIKSFYCEKKSNVYV